MPEYRLQRNGDIDLVFEGELLAERSTHEEGAQRWAELRIWRTDSGKYVTQRLGKTTIPGEVDKIHVRILLDPSKVAEALRSKQGGAEFMSHLARHALDEAAEKDPALARCGVERI